HHADRHLTGLHVWLHRVDRGHLHHQAHHAGGHHRWQRRLHRTRKIFFTDRDAMAALGSYRYRSHRSFHLVVRLGGARAPKLHSVELFYQPLDAVIAPEQFARDVEGGHAERAVALGLGGRGAQVVGSVAVGVMPEARGIEAYFGHHVG